MSIVILLTDYPSVMPRRLPLSKTGSSAPVVVVVFAYLREADEGAPQPWLISPKLVAALFLEGCSPPETSWVVVGVGLRVVQESGVHRKLFSE